MTRNEHSGSIWTIRCVRSGSLCGNICPIFLLAMASLCKSCGDVAGVSNCICPACQRLLCNTCWTNLSLCKYCYYKAEAAENMRAAKEAEAEADTVATVEADEIATVDAEADNRKIC